MEGEGIRDYLRDIGRDVASSLGEELKGVAKDKATAFVKEQFGLGFTDELKSAGREILSAVGSELKGAAKDKATAMIKEQLGLGMDGGAIARPCSVKLPDLRKAITAARRANHIVGKATREQLVNIGEAHADRGGTHAAAIGRYLQGDMTVPRLREMRGLIKGAYHRPVSELTMSEANEYVYWTAKDLGWSWSQLDGIAPKRRQPRGCRVSKHPGRSRDVPVRKERTLTAYQLFIQQHMQNEDNKVDEDGNALSNKERFSNAVAAWKVGGTRRTAARKAAQTRQNRRSERQRMAAVRADVAAERAATARIRSEENQARLRREAPHLARGAPKIPKQSARLQGRGAAYDSGSDDE